MSAHPIEKRMPRPTRRGLVALASPAVLLSAAAIAGSLALAPAAVAAPPAATLAIDVTATAPEGGTVTVTVTATGVTDLYAYDLDLSVPSDLVAYVADSATAPDGGFTTATIDEAAAAGSETVIAVTHTRLGTSPGLISDPAAAAAPITLATLTLRAESAGVAEIDLAGVRLVSGTGEVVTLTDAGSATVTITAATPENPGTPETPGTGTGTGTGAGTGTGTSGTAAGEIAATGADPTPWLITGAFAAALISVGALFVARRRSTAPGGTE